MTVVAEYPQAERERLLELCREHNGPRRHTDTWAPYALMAWAAGIAEVDICAALDRDVLTVRQAVADAIVDDDRYQTALSESYHSE